MILNATACGVGITDVGEYPSSCSISDIESGVGTVTYTCPNKIANNYFAYKNIFSGSLKIKCDKSDTESAIITITNSYSSGISWVGMDIFISFELIYDMT